MTLIEAYKEKTGKKAHELTEEEFQVIEFAIEYFYKKIHGENEGRIESINKILTKV
jgi:hypothetical protein